MSTAAQNARLAVVFKSLVGPWPTSTDVLAANGSLLTISPPPASLVESPSERAFSYRTSAGRVCSSPANCCRADGGVWLDGRCR